MSYNNGVFTLFNQAANIPNIYASFQIPSFSPPPSFTYTSVYGQTIAPSVTTTGSGSVNNAFG